MQHTDDMDYGRLEQVALWMRYVIFVFIANFIVMNIYRKSAVVDDGVSGWGILLLMLSVLFAFFIFKWSKALAHPLILSIVLVVLTFVPLVNLIVLLGLMIQSRKVFKPAGIKMGLLGADMSQFEGRR